MSCEDDAVSARGAAVSPVMDLVDLTPVEPNAGVPPWRDAAWLAQAARWIDDRLAGAGLRRSGRPALRGRIWSVVARVPIEDGRQTAWFKANPPGSAFEPGLMAALARWAPGMSAPLVAVDTDRAWTLTLDAGAHLLERLEGDPDPEHLTALLRRYARLQRDLSGRTDELLALGLPDLRPARLAERLEALLADPAVRASIGPDRLGALSRFTPELRERCARLDAFGVPASLDHGDLHPKNVFGFGESAMPFDWGDASLAHPFSTLLVLLRASKPHFGAGGLARLRSAYLEPWIEDGYRLEDLQRAADLALTITPISRAMAWGRVFPCFADAEEPSANTARWLAALVAADPLGEHGAA